jgi:hypothetical protein
VFPCPELCEDMPKSKCCPKSEIKMNVLNLSDKSENFRSVQR